MQSITNSEFSDHFNVESNTALSSVELNNLFSNQANNNIEFSNTDKSETLFDISLNDSYYTTHEVNQLLNNESKKFFTMCINTRSLVNPHNFSKLECLISELEIKPDIIAINETWEKPNSSGQYKNLNGYNFISNPRLKSKGGGVGMYIKNTLIFTINSELSITKKIFLSLYL